MFDPEELLFLALQDCKRFIRFFNGRTAFENIPRSSELDGSCWSAEALFCEISHDILTPIFSEALETQNHQGSLRILGHTHWLLRCQSARPAPKRCYHACGGLHHINGSCFVICHSVRYGFTTASVVFVC
jgi:hypothetical protein